MTDYTRIPIIQCSYRLAVELQQGAGRFPKTFRFTLGTKLADSSLEFLDGVIKANFCRNPRERMSRLDELSADLFSLRLGLRLATEVKAVSAGLSTVLNEKIEDIQRQLTGWRKWTQKQIA